MPGPKTVIEVLSDKMLIGDGCWEWIGWKNSKGYGQMSIKQKKKPAHRVVYELLVGPIPDGLQLDHLCRNHGCVRPDHLEPVTPRENLIRGNTKAAENVAKTHCPKGHPYDDANTVVTTKGYRKCRECNKIQCREYGKRNPRRR
jgi:hypothetical protein